MKKSIFLSAIVCAALCTLTTGCKTSYLDGGADALYRPSSGYASEYYTEFDISQKRVSNEGASSVLFWFFQFSEGKYCLLNSEPNVTLLASILKVFSPTQIAVDNAKKAALYNTISPIKADQLLGAVYEYTVTNYFVYTKVECKVKGFPAVVRGVKRYDRKPVILNKWQKIEYLAPHEAPVNFSSKVNLTLPASQQ